MGNSASGSLILADGEAQWTNAKWLAYLQSPFRSARSRELDKFGGESLCALFERTGEQPAPSRNDAGLGRPALARGESFDAKARYLAARLAGDAEGIQAMLGRRRPPDSGGSPSPALANGAAGKKGEEKSPSQPSDPSTPLYAPVVVGGMGTPPVSPLRRSGEAARSPSEGNRRGNRSSLGRGSRAALSSSNLFLRDRSRRVAASAEVVVAEWRIRVHQARRRVALTVMAAVRFRACLRKGSLRHASSMSCDARGVASLPMGPCGYVIPLLLGEGEKI